MIHSEYLAGNPLLGRKVWLVRHIKGQQYGDPWDWSVVVVRSHYFTRTAVLKAGMDLSSVQGFRALRNHLAAMGFRWAVASRRKGILKRYRLHPSSPEELTDTPATDRPYQYPG